MPAAPDLVVFDMDDVLAGLDRPRRLSRLAELTGLEAAFIEATVFASDFEPEAEAGAYPDGAAYLEELNLRLGTELSRSDWSRARREAMTVDPDILSLARALRERCRVAMLTNNGPLLMEELPAIAPAIYEVFGAHAHGSYEFRARKPDPVVFQRLLAHYGVAAERAVFIDDNAKNVEGALRAGLVGIHHVVGQDLRDWFIRSGWLDG
ncbi:MAG: HAD family phosphatase [Candidatus Eisenbacteria bacterium]